MLFAYLFVFVCKQRFGSWWKAAITDKENWVCLGGWERRAEEAEENLQGGLHLAIAEHGGKFAVCPSGALSL